MGGNRIKEYEYILESQLRVKWDSGLLNCSNCRIMAYSKTDPHSNEKGYKDTLKRNPVEISALLHFLDCAKHPLRAGDEVQTSNLEWVEITNISYHGGYYKKHLKKVQGKWENGKVGWITCKVQDYKYKLRSIKRRRMATREYMYSNHHDSPIMTRLLE